MVKSSVISLLIDVVSSSSILFRTDPMINHVSASLSINFIKHIEIGDEIFILSKMIKFADSQWILYCEIYNQKYELCYDGHHVKAKFNPRRKKGNKLTNSAKL